MTKEKGSPVQLFIELYLNLMKKNIISVEISVQGFKHQAHWLVHRYFLINLCKHHTQKLSFRVKFKKQAQETNTSRWKTTHSNKRHAMHYHIKIKTWVNRKILTDTAHTMKAEKQSTCSKAYFTLSLLKTCKFSRKNTGINDNTVLQVEKFLKFPTHFHLGTNLNEIITPANLTLFKESRKKTYFYFTIALDKP